MAEQVFTEDALSEPPAGSGEGVKKAGRNTSRKESLDDLLVAIDHAWHDPGSRPQIDALIRQHPDWAEEATEFLAALERMDEPEDEEWREAHDRLHDWLLSTGIDQALAEAARLAQAAETLRGLGRWTGTLDGKQGAKIWVDGRPMFAVIAGLADSKISEAEPESRWRRCFSLVINFMNIAPDLIEQRDELANALLALRKSLATVPLYNIPETEAAMRLGDNALHKVGRL